MIRKIQAVYQILQLIKDSSMIQLPSYPQSDQEDIPYNCNTPIRFSKDGQFSIIKPSSESRQYDNLIVESEQESEDEVVVDSPKESDEDRIRRDNEESERLCWELMRQESVASYELQLNFMRENRNDLTPEDLQALELFMNINQEQEQEQEQIDIDDSVNEVNDEEEVSGDNYDRLIQLGEIIEGNYYHKSHKLTYFYLLFRC